MKSILYVDDDSAYRPLFVDALKAGGYEVTSFETLKSIEGLEVKKLREYDLIILDGSIDAKKDGWKYVEKLNKMGINSLVLSASDLSEEFKDVPYLLKGRCLMFELVKEISNIISEKRN